jgi:alkanesulfonate monooxygenase SsuD/methylene tetrahydromethanopterin reductase-like flavin-dependent oxidoreductase (luciferase family)
MEFGVFDHLDRGDGTLADFYAARLRLAEAYDRAGFYSYHIAEHHGTPLGMAPSPAVFLAAVAQRTRRLRFGPMVYCLPLYHPLRLIEEICMLDQMSGGRFDLGVGRGISPIEIASYGVDPAMAAGMFGECWEVVLQGLTRRTVDFEGEFYRFHDVPMELEPFQKPHPALWFGVSKPDSAERAARQGLNFLSNATLAGGRSLIAAYRAAYVAPPGRADPPKLGLSRFIVIADTDGAALDIARRAYRGWYRSFHKLWWKHDQRPVGVSYPPEFDGQVEEERAVAGTIDTVVETLRHHVAVTGMNYLVGRFAFGDMATADSLRSIELFARHVMPALRHDAEAAE